MNKLILISVLIAIAIVSVSLIFVFDEKPLPESKPVYTSGFTFYDVEKIQSALATQNITMSSPTAITDHTVNQYCTYFDGDIQKTVEYCTTTAIADSNGKAFGNINLGGSVDSPILALAILDTPDVYENDVDFVFQTMIETLVCDCWEEKQPGGFESINAWLDAAKTKYAQSSSPTLKSKIDGLNGLNLTLEITSNDDKYLWTLIILK